MRKPTIGSTMTPQNWYPADSYDPAKIRMIAILRRPPTRCGRRITHVMQEELTHRSNHYTKFTMEPTKEHILQQRLQRAKNTNRYNTKIQIIHKSQIHLSTDKNTNGTKSPEDNQVASITLPRPSWKVNLASNVLHRTVLHTCPVMS
jgi:hypothetical protein